MGGDSGGDGGVGAAADAAKRETDRKQSLRTRINQLYGIADPNGVTTSMPTNEQFTTYGEPVSYGELGWGQGPATFNQAGYDKAVADFKAAEAAGGTDPVAKAARDAEAKAEADLSGATRGYYEDQLQHDTDRAMRRNRFALADRGTLGGSAQIDTEGEIKRDNTLGATRIADQVSNAVTGLRNNNEQERLNAINLVNAGAGEDSVQSAQAGISRALSNAQSAGKANITSDLFSGLADQVSAANGSYNPLLLAQYQKGLGSFFNPGGGGAKVTAT